ncbi:MAG: class I SAM-dependent methyltransferase [Planctomycetota bacterium]
MSGDNYGKRRVGYVNTTQSYCWGDKRDSHSTRYLWPEVEQLLRSGEDISRVLDLGCGNGNMTRRVKEAGFDTIGLEPDDDGIQIAKQEHPDIPFEKLGVGDDPGEHQAAWDAVIACEVVEHLFDPFQLPRFAAKVLRPGGRLIVTTPYHGYLKNLALAVRGQWGRHLQPLRNGGHIKFFAVDSLTKLLNMEGFEVVDVRGAGRPWPFWASMIVTGQLTGNADE